MKKMGCVSCAALLCPCQLCFMYGLVVMCCWPQQLINTAQGGKALNFGSEGRPPITPAACAAVASWDKLLDRHAAVDAGALLRYQI